MASAAQILRHYIERACERAGVKLDRDCLIELEAAQQELEAALARGEAAAQNCISLQKQITELERRLRRTELLERRDLAKLASDLARLALDSGLRLGELEERHAQRLAQLEEAADRPDWRERR